MTSPRTYPATINRWVDGDTVELVVDIGFYLTTRQHFRLRGYNSPEVVGVERAEGLASLVWARRLAPEGSPVTVLSTKGDKYGRWLADLILDDGRSLVALLIDAGAGKPWDGSGPKP